MINTAQDYVSDVLARCDLELDKLSMFEAHGIAHCRTHGVPSPRCAEMLLEMREQLSSAHQQLMEDKS